MEPLETRTMLNAAPVATDDILLISQDSSAVIDTMALNDTDADGDTLMVDGVTNASHGSIVDNGGGSYTYTPNAGYAGTDQFSYIVIDGNDAFDIGLVKITVSQAIDVNAARTQILSGVSTLVDPDEPGRIAPFGPEAYAIANDSGGGAIIAAAGWGKGRVVAMNDHQWLEMDLETGSGTTTARYYENSIAWLAETADKDIKIVTYNVQDNASWLTGHGYTNVVTANPSNLATHLNDAAVFAPGWLGSTVSTPELDSIADYVRGGGGLFIADYGAGYDLLWGKPVYNAPGNVLLREAGIGFPHDSSAGVTATPATGHINATTVLDMLDDPSGYTQSQLDEGWRLLEFMFDVLPPGDSLLARLDANLPPPTGPLITEFMASNDTTLADGDGNYSDWIELTNPTDQAIDLAGWHLTDIAGDLTRWTFPTAPTVHQDLLELTPGETMIVFASGQTVSDYVDAEGNLHTDFKLNSDGEYLALVQADGITVEHEYAPEFPPQTKDISYGLAFDTKEAVLLINEGADARYVIPSGSIANWNATGLDDSSWSIGPTGIGYELSPADYDDLIETAIDPGPTTVYVRQSFDVADLNSINTLSLQVRYDDGFVAYLNGVLVAQANAPANPQWDSQATATHSDDAAVLFESFNISAHRSLLQSTGNVLAIQLLNAHTNSSDLLLEPMLTASQASIVPHEVGFMDNPSPGEPNNDIFLGFVADTNFSVDRGFYQAAIDVTVTTATAGALIVYTTDGTTPAVDDELNVTNGQLVSGPIHIDSTTTLRAAAFRFGYRPSNTDTHTYLYLDDIVLQSPNGQAPSGFPTSSVNGQVFDYGMDPNITGDPVWGPQLDGALTQIPTLSIVTDGDNLFDPSIGIYVNASHDGLLWERPTSLELIQPDGTAGFQVDAGLRIRGGFSRGDFNPKHSFRLFFRSEYGNAKLKFPLFGDEGVDEFDTVDLRTAQNYAWSNNTFNDQLQNTFLRDIYSRDLQRELGHAYTRGRYYHLLLNGQYWGLYQTEERPEASYASSYFGGDKEGWDAVKASGGIEATDGDLTAWVTLSNLADAGFSTDAAYYFVQGRNPDGTLNPAYEQHVDMDNLIDFMTNVFFTGNQDMPTGLGGGGPNNFWAIRPRDGSHGWRWIAHDNEHNLGTSRDGDPKDDNIYYDQTGPTSSGGSPSSFNPKYLHQQLMDHPEYRSRFADRVHRAFFNDGPLTTANAQSLLDSRSIQIDQAIIAESARWGDQHNEPPLTKNTWSTEVDWLRNFFLAQRRDIVLGQLRSRGLYPSTQYDAPSFNQHGGAVPIGFQLAITNHEPAGTIYYTLDGTDPRNVGGNVAGTAIPYTGEFSLTQSLTVKMRLLRSGQWSALVEADFLVGVLADATNLSVTELSYHPYVALTQFGELDVDNDRFEFIELINTSTNDTIDLTDVHFSDGIDFTFDTGQLVAPGERILVVRDIGTFESRYGTGHNIAGVFQNDTGLSNGGETIKLDDAIGYTIVEFTYDDSGDWPGRADGKGATLEVIDTAGDYNSAVNWRSSNEFGGSPGTAGTGPVYDVIVNEVLSHSDGAAPDLIELTNTTATQVDLSRWYLSDASANFFQFQLSAGTTINAGQYLVFNETQLGFGLDGQFGDDVWLLAADNATGRPLRFADHHDFDATDTDISLGRWPNGDPSGMLFPMTAQTFGNANSDPLFGDMLITEVHYNPADVPLEDPGNIAREELEFIELTNNHGGSLDISHWSVEGIGFTFPAGTTVAVGEAIVVVTFDPVLEPTKAAAFRNLFSMADTARLFGAASGQLNNAGESVKLLKPEDPLTLLTGNVLVDAVHYDDLPPWPVTADGDGHSLTRTAPNDFALLASSWTAEIPTPGSVLFIPAIPGDFDADGDVDGDDLGHWQNGFGTTTGASLSDGDSDDDGDVDGTDFLNWQLHTTALSLLEIGMRDAQSSPEAIRLDVLQPNSRISQSTSDDASPELAAAHSGDLRTADSGTVGAGGGSVFITKATRQGRSFRHNLAVDTAMARPNTIIRRADFHDHRAVVTDTLFATIPNRHTDITRLVIRSIAKARHHNGLDSRADLETAFEELQELPWE